MEVKDSKPSMIEIVDKVSEEPNNKTIEFQMFK